MTTPEEIAREIITVKPGDGGYKVYLFGDLVYWELTEENANVIANSWRVQLAAALAASEQRGPICPHSGLGDCAADRMVEERDDLRAQLQASEQDHKETRAELQRVLGLLMDQDEKVAASERALETQEKGKA